MIDYVSDSGIKYESSDFAGQLRDLSGVDYNRCYQCLTCTLSCPVVSIMDYPPNQMIRLIQMGAINEVLRSATIWRCASCETCVSRCPQGIDIRRLMDALRQMALQEHKSGKEKIVPAFHNIFLNNIRQWGREYELGMIIALKIKSRDFFGDLVSGMKMLLKRKLSLIPGRIENLKDMKALFERSEKERV